MSVKIEATGKTIADAFAAFGRFNLEAAETDDLLLELRHRLAEKGQVVKIVPFAEARARRAA
jgi:hypothetical protein